MPFDSKLQIASEKVLLFPSIYVTRKKYPKLLKKFLFLTKKSQIFLISVIFILLYHAITALSIHLISQTPPLRFGNTGITKGIQKTCFFEVGW